MARIDKSSPIRLGLLALAGALLCLVLWVVLFDPLPSILDVVNTAWIRWQLPAARECWASSGVASCRVDVEGSVPMACLLDGELAVREGRVVGVRMRTNALIPGSPLQDVDPSEWGRPGCAYEDLTVDSMFDRLKADLSRAGLSGEP